MTSSGLTHLFHRRTSPQRFIVFVAPLVTVISHLSGPVRLSVRYTTPDIHCRDRQYKCGGGIVCQMERSPVFNDSLNNTVL